MHQLECCLLSHTKFTFEESTPANMPPNQNQEHRIYHSIRIILFKPHREFRESPKFWSCVTKLHKGLGWERAKCWLYYWKSCLRMDSGVLSEWDRGIHLVTEALDIPRPLGHVQDHYCLVYCMTEGKPDRSTWKRSCGKYFITIPLFNIPRAQPFS